ncbi:peptide chain release factor N(5)-glutamine methyltransferase [Rothia kristinae]|uniref:peptide chain release factor N(5)-glutamine methyltransferase n=1 Tax=Rothia kristinae TaxID=37923 RepID=UPI00341F68BB
MGPEHPRPEAAPGTDVAPADPEPALAPGAPLSAGLRCAHRLLAEAGIASARVDAELLVAHLLADAEGRAPGRGEVAAGAITGRFTVPAGYAELIRRRAAREPLQHLTGRAPFRRLELLVGPGVFVARPETEVLVDEVSAHLAARRAEAQGSEASGSEPPGSESAPDPAPLVVDLATGSGALALAVAQENPGTRVIGVERSETALAWAERNARRVAREHGVRIDLRREDARDALPGAEGTVEAIVTNPPYIPEDAVPRDPEVARYDPPEALYGGSPDGLAIPTAFLERAARLLRPGGLLVMEHAEVQAGAVAALFRDRGFHRVRTVRDLTGRDRATAGLAPGYPGERAESAHPRDERASAP